MKHITSFNSVAEATACPGLYTPQVCMIEGVSGGLVFAKNSGVEGEQITIEVDPESGKVVPVPVYDGPLNDEIWYTSSNGQKISPTFSNAFKDINENTLTFINTYKDGKGVLKFNGNIAKIGIQAFYQCSDLTSVTIPNSVTSIGDDAFQYCSSLISITIPNSVTIIRNDTFYQCSSLTSVTIPNSVTIIGNNAFEGCSSLTSVTIPNSVTIIGNQAFDGCSNLTTVTIGNNVTSIYQAAFIYCYSLTSIIIPVSVTGIGNYAFGGCRGLTSIIVESGNSIYDSRENCNAIIETSSNKLVQGCQNTIIPNSITSIGQWAFSDCDSLTSITIPNSVTNIGEYAFDTNVDITITLESIIPPTIGEDAFGSVNSGGGESTSSASSSSSSSSGGEGGSRIISILVPAEAYDTYMNAEGYWEYYRDYIQPISL